MTDQEAWDLYVAAQEAIPFKSQSNRNFGMELVRQILKKGAHHVWNTALEAAAQVADSVNTYDNPMTAHDVANEIRAKKRPAVEEPIDLEKPFG